MAGVVATLTVVLFVYFGQFNGWVEGTAAYERLSGRLGTLEQQAVEARHETELLEKRLADTAARQFKSWCSGLQGNEGERAFLTFAGECVIPDLSKSKLKTIRFEGDIGPSPPDPGR